MVADTGGNTGSQSATVVVRALGLGEVRPGAATGTGNRPWHRQKKTVLPDIQSEGDAKDFPSRFPSSRAVSITS
ncbi:MAG: hypothetical protein R6V54_12955 [Desulfobacteraceae bacterium]